MANTTVIGFIGGGNMARSLIGGLLADGYEPDLLKVCDPDASQRNLLAQQFQIEICEKAEAIITSCDCLVLAVKPQVLHLVAKEISALIGEHCPLMISIAAGVREHTLRRWLGQDCAIVRCMPNTPALVSAGATALFANQRVTVEQRNLAESILRAVGLTLWVEDEAALDAVTAVSGSGPAYIFLVIEAMQAAAESLGLSPEQSRLLCVQTAFGAAKMALEAAEPASVLREQVTSKGGTTESALQVFKQAGIMELFNNALTAARDRSEELAADLDQN